MDLCSYRKFTGVGTVTQGTGVSAFGVRWRDTALDVWIYGGGAETGSFQASKAVFRHRTPKSAGEKGATDRPVDEGVGGVGVALHLSATPSIMLDSPSGA